MFKKLYDRIIKFIYREELEEAYTDWCFDYMNDLMTEYLDLNTEPIDLAKECLDD